MSLKILTEFSATIGTSPFVIFGFLLVTMSVTAISMSRQRHLLLFILAGMFYWLFVEILQAGLSQVFPLSEWHAYVVAMTMIWLPAVLRLVYQSNQKHKESFSYYLYQMHVQDQRFDISDAENQIEHTPMYYDYSPKFQ